MNLPKLPPHKQQLGKIGEDIAASYLRKQGYHIIDRNFKARYGEIDLICIQKDTLVFVEVKTRTGEQFGKPEEAVTPKKLREIVQTATYYQFYTQNYNVLTRIDVISILCREDLTVRSINHIVNVTS